MRACVTSSSQIVTSTWASYTGCGSRMDSSVGIGSSLLLLHSLLHPLEHKADVLGLVRADRNRLSRGPQLLVPRFDRVSAGRKAAQIEAAVLAGHGEIRVL